MLQLYINNTLADVSDSTLITVTKTYENLSNPTLYYSEYSKTVKLPISARNNAIFSNFNRLDSLVTNVSIDPAKKIPFFILNNQEMVMDGYLRLDNSNTIYTDECYEVTLFSMLGLVMNELKLLTFNKNAVDVDPQYIIDSPISDDLIIDRNLVKQSFEQQTHHLNGNDVTDWIGFIPTYQGKYSNFASDKEQIFPEGRVDELPMERDEHYMREFRSYYQQPFIWVDKLWKVAKDKIEEITDYQFNLDRSWFNSSNPYYSDLIYTCPSLFNSDDTFKSVSERFEDELNVEMFNVAERTNQPLSTHRNILVQHLTPVSDTDLYNSTTATFNPNGDMGGSQVKGRFKLTLFASPVVNYETGRLSKIRKDNPFYVRIKAVRASDGTQITGAKKTFLVYSSSYSVSDTTFDEGIDVGVCDMLWPDITTSNMFRPLINSSGYHFGSDGHYWEAELNFELNITENTPYKVYIEVWNANNGCPFEYSSGISGNDWVPRWDWLWIDYFNTSVGSGDKGYSMYFDSVNVNACTAENLRSFSDVSLYRIFPKDVTLCDVLLNYSKMFGLVWTVDDITKEITVMTRNRFFQDYHIEDWTEKIDRSKEFKFNPLNFDKKYVTFNFEEGKCGRLENYEDMYQYTYGTKKLDTGYDFNSDENKLFSNLQPSVVAQKKQYSQMYNTTRPDRPNFMGYSYMIYPEERYVDNDKEGSNAGMSGAFYFRNGTFTPDARLSLPPSAGEGYYILVSDDTQHQIQTGEYCWNMCGENMTKCYKIPNVSTISKIYDGKRYSVHFEKPKEYFFVTPEGDHKYIYNSYWENYINERYCTQNKKLTAYIYLPINEFAKIDFREFVKIDNILYHIDKIYDYNFNTEEAVKMDLVQVWDLSAYTEGQLDFPYLFTDEESYTVTTTSQTITVHSSRAWSVLSDFLPSWITATNVDGGLVLSANSETETYREATVTLTLNNSQLFDVANRLWYTITVVQYPNVQYRLDTDYHTVVFDDDGGTQVLNVDCTDLSNNVVSVTTNRTWLTASIPEYIHSIIATGRNSLHLNITAQPNTSTFGRHGIVTLSATMGGLPFQTTVYVGQQGGDTNPRIFDDDIITNEYDINEGFEVLDNNDAPVNYLIGGNTYHFTDLFPEEIDINSLRISNGTVDITGNAGEQTVTFTPVLSNGDEVSGGVITAKTLSGVDLTYNYDVYYTAPKSMTYFYVEDISGAANTLSIVKGSSSAPTVTVYKSTDQMTWELMGNTDTTAITATIPANGRLYLKATTNVFENNTIKCTNNFNVGGNIMSLLYGDDFENKTKLEYMFSFLSIFANSTNLINAKDLLLPATTLNQNCYNSMFDGCTSLTTAPELPATTLDFSCYGYMFYGCTSLTTAPALPATTLAYSCYEYMFGRCASLTKTPVLPVTKLVNGCYWYMFSDCTSLNQVITYADDISASGCITNWLDNVAATGDFYNMGTATYTVDSVSGIPSGWTVKSSDPPAPPTPPTPPVPVVPNRIVIIKSSEGGLFRIAIDGDITKTTDYYENKLNDGTVIKLTAVADDNSKFVDWKNTVGATLTTPAITFTVGSSLVGEDGVILYYPEFATSNDLVTLTVNGGGGYITIGDDSTHYDPLVKRVPAGTTICNIQAHSGGIASFVKWSDGSTTNNRDFTVTTDTTLTPIFINTGNQQIILDGSGLTGVNDYLTLSINGTPTLSAGLGEVDTTKQANATYALVLDCQIKDLDSKFNWFKHTDSRDTNYYYNNPATYSYQMTNTKSNSTITVSTVPSLVYWTNDNAVDYATELVDSQDWLLDGVFKSEKYDKEVVIEVEPNKPMTLAITTDYKLTKAIDDQDRDVFSDMTMTQTANGNWLVFYLPDTQDAGKIILQLVSI